MLFVRHVVFFCESSLLRNPFLIRLAYTESTLFPIYPLANFSRRLRHLLATSMSSLPTTPTTSRPSPALRTPFSSPREYTRLSSDDEADDAEPPAAVQPSRLDPETAQELQRKFLSHVARARRRQTDAGAVVQLVVGGDAWVIDLRPQVPLASVVQPGRVTAPDVRLAISPDDLQAVLDRRLSPFRAWQSKQLVVSGDLLKLRAMKWLRDGDAADEGDAGLSHERMGVRVVGTSTEGGFGSYMLRVTEGATAWSVSRRWSECKALVKALALEYGPGTPFDLPLPALRSSVLGAMQAHATRASELHARSHQLELCLARTLRLLHTSARVWG